MDITPRSYYRLCDTARTLGVSVSLDDPQSPQTVDELVDAVVVRTQRAWVPWTGVFPLRSEILAKHGITE